MHHYAFLDIGGEREGEHLLSPPSFPPLASCLGQSHKPHLLFMLNLPEGPNYRHSHQPTGRTHVCFMAEAEGLTCGKGLDLPHTWKQQLAMEERSSHEKKSEMHKRYSKSRWTHTHTHTTVWAKTQPFAMTRANAFTRKAAFRWTFSMWQFFILGTTFLYVATEKPLCLVDAIWNYCCSWLSGVPSYNILRQSCRGSILFQAHCVSLSICMSQDWIIFMWIEGQNSHLFTSKM